MFECKLCHKSSNSALALSGHKRIHGKSQGKIHHNPNGLSRDHKINEAIKNNYDPYYITHPMNCDLISHKQNNKKNTMSSITYEKLITLIDNF